jgi:hypothetical protein
MNFEDATLVRMATPETRTTLFDSVSLAQCLSAAYDLDGDEFGGPFLPVFEELQIGLPVNGPSTIEGMWFSPEGLDRKDARFQVFDGGPVTNRAEALWQGSIVARVSLATSRVTSVQSAWPDPGTIDAEILEELGALPADPADLETQRARRLLARIRAGLKQPETFTDAAFAEWLRNLGATTVSALIEKYSGTTALAALQVGYSDATAGPSTPLAFPVVAVLLIRNPGFSIAALLAESKRVRKQLEDQGVGATAAPPLRLRRPVLPIWVVPSTTFDDPDWPGAPPAADAAAARQARRTAAGLWLAQEGIGLVPVGA